MHVAPLAGAWIEITNGGFVGLSGASLPSRERGLKSFLSNYRDNLTESLPSRERGLKS